LRIVKFMAKKMGLRANAAAGPDGIGSRLLKELSSGLAPALLVIPYSTKGEIPNAWKEANVMAIFMKRAKSSPGNS
jgi:hypothetical protein